LRVANCSDRHAADYQNRRHQGFHRFLQKRGGSLFAPACWPAILAARTLGQLARCQRPDPGYVVDDDSERAGSFAFDAPEV
jgi:hypothetical protein